MPFTVCALSFPSTVAGANGSFLVAADVYPQEKGAAVGSANRGTILPKREVKKVSRSWLKLVIPFGID